MRADRLLMILSLIQTHGQMSSRDLAAQLEVSERTIHRDMEALGIAGIPVYAVRGSKGGWALSEGYRSQLTGITTDEISSLLLLHSSSVVRDLGLNGHVQTAFRKLLSALPSAVQRDAEYVRQRIHLDGAGWHSDSQSRVSYLSTVQEAVWGQRKLSITYRRWDSDSDTQRIVSPLGLVAKRSTWYMISLNESDEEEGEIRTYRISRLKGATMLEETFARPVDFNLASYWELSTERFKSNLPHYPAQVRIASAWWSKFTQQRYVNVQNHKEIEDGRWVEADVEFNTFESALEILLGCGRHAQALSPDELRHGIHEESKAIVSLYEAKK
jgi:predicted DNA-binding transcriptional regulator YafY